MTAITFDTYTYVKKLKAVGFTEEQAEVQAKALSELSDERLVTREYLDLRLKELKTELMSEIKASKSESKLHFVIILFVIFLSNPKSLELIARILGIIK